MTETKNGASAVKSALTNAPTTLTITIRKRMLSAVKKRIVLTVSDAQLYAQPTQSPSEKIPITLKKTAIGPVKLSEI